jgi:methylated-DNA-[protein]-cysteine S-methyltransferase
MRSPDEVDSLARTVLPDTPAGPLTLVASARGIRELRFGLPAGPEPGISSLPGPEALAHLDAARRFLEDALAPEVPSGDAHGPAPLPALDLDGATPFRRRVWAALLRIPRGTVMTYGALSDGLGVGSPRAVGQAVGANPVPILVPCHRVVAGEGRLGGFSGGLDRKVELLALEGFTAGGAHFDAPLGGSAQGTLAL